MLHLIIEDEVRDRRVALMAETAELKVRALAARLVRFARRSRAGPRPPSGGAAGRPDR